MRLIQMVTVIASQLVFIACGTKKETIWNPCSGKLKSEFSECAAKDLVRVTDAALLKNRMVLAKSVFPELTQGWSPVSGSLAFSCVEGRIPDSSQIASRGQSVTYSDGVIKTQSDLRNLLGIAANGKGVLHFNNASLELSKLQKVAISSHSFHYFIQMQVFNSEIRMQDVKLSKEAIELLKTGGSDALVKQCGTHALVGYKTGGLYTVIVNISPLGKKPTIGKSLEQLLTENGLNAAEGSEKFLESLKNVDQKFHVTFSTFRSGTKGVPLELDVEKVGASFADFPAGVAESPMAIELVTLPLVSLVPELNVSSVAQLNDKMKEITRKLDAQVDQKNDINYVLELDNTLTGQEKEAIRADIDVLEKDITDLKFALEKCESKIAECGVPNTLGRLSQANSFYREWSEISSHELCGVERFNEQEDALVCGTIDENFTRPEERPVPVTEAHPDCGVKEFNSKRDERCGCDNPWEVRAGFGCARKVCARPEFGVKEYHTCTREVPRVVDVPDVRKKARKCANKAFGVALYKTCRHRI